MAPFLRASLHGLRSTLCSQRELRLLKLPESKNVMWRWYSETAMFEDSNQAVNDTAGENGISVSGSPKSIDDVGNQGPAKDMLTARAKQENATEESPTDKLTSLILGKMRSRNSTSSAMPPQAGTTSSKVGKPMEESNESARKWDQVMESMRNMAAKRKEQLGRSGTKPTLSKFEDSEDQDDFADLDGPSGELSKTLCDLQRTDVSFDAVSSTFKRRDTGFQASNMKQRAKEAKTVSFSFLKGLENNASSAKPQSSGGQSLSDGNAGLPFSSKPLSFEFLKSSERKNGRPHGGQAKTDDTTHPFSLNDKHESNAPPSRLSDGNAGLPFSSKPPSFEPLSFEFLKSSERKNGRPHGGQAKTDDTTHPFSLNDKHESNAPPSLAGVHTRMQSSDEQKREAARLLGHNDSMLTRSSGYIVCVHNLSSQSNLALIKEALSIHGEVVSSFKKPNSNGSWSAFIEFKTSEARDEAIAARWLQMDSKSFSIVRADSPITTVVRISRVSATTTDNQVQGMCEKFGNIDQIRKRGNGVYDVFYRMGELSNMVAILDSLNEVTLNQRRWVALPAPLLHPGVRKEVLKSSEGQAWHAQQLSQTLGRLEMGLEAMSVYFEDLKSLVAMEDEFTK